MFGKITDKYEDVRSITFNKKTTYMQTYNSSLIHGYYPCKIFIFLGKFLSLNIRCFSEKSVFAVFYCLLVTHLIAHRFTLGNPVIAIPIMYLLRVIEP